MGDGVALIAKLFGLGIILTIAEMVLNKSGKNDVAFGIGLAGVAIIMIIVVAQVAKLFGTVTTMFSL